MPSHKTVRVELPIPEANSPQVLRQLIAALPWTGLSPPYVVVPTAPQITPGAATVILVPSWVSESDQRVVLYDFSDVGGPVYAGFCHEFLSAQDLANEAQHHRPASGLAIHRPTGQQVTTTIRVHTGDVICFCRPQTTFLPKITFETLLSREESWDPQPVHFVQERPASFYVVLTEDRMHRIYGNPSMASIHHQVAAAMHRRPEHVYFDDLLPAPFTDDYLCYGHAVHGVLAAAWRSETLLPGPNLGIFVFLDCRSAGHSLCPVFVEERLHAVNDLIRSIHLRTPGQLVLTAAGLSSTHVRPAAGQVIPIGFCRTTVLDTTCLDTPAQQASLLDQELELSRDPPIAPPASPSEVPLKIVSGMTDSGGEDSDATTTISAKFLVLRLDGAAVTVHFEVPAPASIATAMDALSLALSNDIYYQCSQVQPVEPQVSPQWGLALALPPWSSQEPILVFNLLQMDGRLYAVTAALEYDRERLCALAKVDPANVDIYAYGSASPLLSG